MVSEAKYIWYDDMGCGHNLYGLFRKSFIVNLPVRSTVLNIFADTVYQLFVNGEFAGFGPVRFDPRFPLYDTYEISSYLKQGNNSIAILVNYIGHKTFKSIPNRAGLMAWGTVEANTADNIRLDTYAGSWKCTPSIAHSIPSCKLSFALNNAEIFHQGMEECGWKDTEFDDSHWKDAVELIEQDSWGKLEPRSIPYMRLDSTGISGKLKVFPLMKLEQLYSFRVPTPFIDEEENKAKYSGCVAFSTWIFSKVDRTVVIGTTGEDIWINGQRELQKFISWKKNMRVSRKWNLKKGWNYYFGYLNASQGVTEHYLAIPCGDGLEVTADRKTGSQYKFRHSPLLSAAEFEKHLKNKPVPYDSDESLDEIGGWIYTTQKDAAQSPCIESGWDDYADAFEEVGADRLHDHVFYLSDYPHGFCILVDLDYMHLVFPKICIEGIKGATIDLTYSERLNGDNEHTDIQSWIPMGDRIICNRDSIEWFPAHPRGARFVSITVRNITGNVTVNSISFCSASYPVSQKGSFTCSDPCLNAVWLMGRRTEEANMEDAYVDCSGRERGMYGRDTIIQYHVNLAAFGDHSLMRRSMELFGQSPDSTGKFRAVYPNTGDYTISDFALNLVEGYRNYYENTGDADLIRKCWNAIKCNLKWFHELADEREDLLLDSEWHLKRGIKAHYGGFHGDNAILESHMDNTGIHCVFSCTYLLALQSASSLAHIIGKETDAAELQRRIAILVRTIPEKFWDAKEGCFGDNLIHNTHSIHANIFAIRTGVVFKDRLEPVKEHIRRQLKSLFVNGFDPTDGVLVSPHFAFYIFDGLYKAGLYETAESMMKQGWGWMLSQGLKTCSEFFSLKYSLCHAWSASPTYYLSKNILGVHFPKAPDMDEVEIRVNTCSVTCAEGAFPHPRGVIEIKWHTEDGKRVFDRVKAPDGVNIRVTG